MNHATNCRLKYIYGLFVEENDGILLGNDRDKYNVCLTGQGGQGEEDSNSFY